MNTNEKINSKYESIKVSGKSEPSSVAGYVTSIVVEAWQRNMFIEMYCELLSIGAAATNQAIKALAIAPGMMADKGAKIVVTHAFTNVMIDGEERTAMRSIIQRG